MSFLATLSSSASAIKIIQRIVSAPAEPDGDFAIVVGSDEGSAHESPSPFLAITPPPRSRLGASPLHLCYRLSTRRGRFCAHIHRRRRSAVLLHAFGIWHARPPQVVGSNYAVHHRLSQLSSGGRKETCGTCGHKSNRKWPNFATEERRGTFLLTLEEGEGRTQCESDVQ